MAKAILITQNDYGIELLVTMKNEEKEVVDLTNKIVNVAIVTPDNRILDLQGYPTKNIGECSVILETEHTSTEGTYSTYWTLIDDNGLVTAQEGLYYTVLAKNGGATSGE